MFTAWPPARPLLMRCLIFDVCITHLLIPTDPLSKLIRMPATTKDTMYPKRYFNRLLQIFQIRMNCALLNTLLKVFFTVALGFSLSPAVLGAEMCSTVKLEHGFGLVGHQYESSEAGSPFACYLRCEASEKCRSMTYWISTRLCHLNNETKATKPGGFMNRWELRYLEKPRTEQQGNHTLPSG